MYRILSETQIQHIETGAFIPVDPLNGDYHSYLAWQAEGNVADLPGEKTFDQRKREKIDALAEQRYQVETSGAVVPGLGTIPTDRIAQERISQALLAFGHDFIADIQWKLPQGFIALDQNQMIAIAQAVAQHVQSCFQHEATLRAAIEAAADDADLAAIAIGQGWPPNN